MGFQPFPIFGRGLRRGFGRGNDGGEHITSMASRILAIKQANLIGYWKQGESSGTVVKDSSPTGNDAAYAGTFTLAQPGIGDGSPSVLYIPTTGRGSFAATLVALAAVFSGATGTLLIWARVANVGVLTDATIRTIVSFGVDASNRVFIQKTATNSQLSYSYRAGGVAKTFNANIPGTDWFSAGITWDKPNDICSIYLNGALASAPQNSLGVYAGTLSAAFTALGDFQSAGGGQPWSGFEAHGALWNAPLTAAEMARVGVPSAS